MEKYFSGFKFGDYELVFEAHVVQGEGVQKPTALPRGATPEEMARRADEIKEWRKKYGTKERVRVGEADAYPEGTRAKDGNNDIGDSQWRLHGEGEWTEEDERTIAHELGHMFGHDGEGYEPVGGTDSRGARVTRPLPNYGGGDVMGWSPGTKSRPPGGGYRVKERTVEQILRDTMDSRSQERTRLGPNNEVIRERSPEAQRLHDMFQSGANVTR